MRRALLLVAGGSGKRMGGVLPKQYQDLEGKALILHTLERFLEFDPRMKLVLVLANEHRHFWEDLCKRHSVPEGIELAPGGSARFFSVRNGLQLLEEGLIVGIHDAVRPFVSLETLERCYHAASKWGGAIPVMAMDESVRMVKEDGTSLVLDRSSLMRVQTPQVFKSEMIKEAYSHVSYESHTDDASVFEAHFGHIQLVEGNRQNIKITTPTDLQLASVLIRSAE